MLKIIKDIITDHYNYLLFKLILFSIRQLRLSQTIEKLIISEYSNKLEAALEKTKRKTYSWF